MHKLIGTKEEFAIQYEITGVVNQFIYGHICYWINGIQIGDYDSNTLVSDTLVFLPQIIKDNGKRKHKSFFTLEKEVVYYLLSGQAYCDDDKYEEQAIEEIWARFNISMGLDVFGDTAVNLVDDYDTSRIVFVDNNKALREFYIEKGVVDSVFVDFYNEINSYYEK